MQSITALAVKRCLVDAERQHAALIGLQGRDWILDSRGH